MRFFRVVALQAACRVGVGLSFLALTACLGRAALLGLFVVGREIKGWRKKCVGLCLLLLAQPHAGGFHSFIVLVSKDSLNRNSFACLGPLGGMMGWDYLLSSSVQMATRFQSGSLNMLPTPWPSAVMRLAAMPYFLMRMFLTASARSRARRVLISGLPSGEA